MLEPSEPTLFYIPYQRFLDELEAVAQAIEGDEWRPDFLVGIGRGGLVPVRRQCEARTWEVV